MAFELHRGEGFPAFAASVITNLGGRQVVTLVAGARQVAPIGTVNVEPFGVTHAAASTIGDAVAVHEAKTVVKVVAAASLGAGADIGVASSNGALGPQAGASGSVTWRVGKSMESAAAGETFSLYVNPRQLSGPSWAVA